MILKNMKKIKMIIRLFNNIFNRIYRFEIKQIYFKCFKLNSI